MHEECYDLLEKGIRGGLGMLEIHQALKIVKEVARKLNPSPIGVEMIPILESMGRIMAEPISLEFPQPPFDRSMRDGYALRAIDSIHAPLTLSLIGENAAGHVFCGTLQAGESLAIMTGAPMPPGADSVVMLEDVSMEDGGRIGISKSVRRGLNVAKTGSEHKAGEAILRKGDMIGSAELAILAAMGKSVVRVFPKPRVAVLVTGDELAGIDHEPDMAEIRDSNSYALWGQIISAGGLPVRLGIVKDQPYELLSALEKGLDFDVLVVSGGVSKGKYDLVKPLLLELGAVLHFESLKLKPGKPAVFATARGKYVFGLPGNPVSAFVTFELLARPLLRFLQGAVDDYWPVAMATLKQKVQEKPGRTKILPAQVLSTIHGLEAEPVEYKGSADIFAIGRANGFIVIPAEASLVREGDQVQVWLLKSILSKSMSQDLVV